MSKWLRMAALMIVVAFLINNIVILYNQYRLLRLATTLIIPSHAQSLYSLTYQNIWGTIVNVVSFAIVGYSIYTSVAKYHHTKDEYLIATHNYQQFLREWGE